MFESGKVSKEHEALINLFETWSGEEMLKFTPLPRSGSDRMYFRIFGSEKKAIGVINKDHKENIAFLTFSKQFRASGIKVPEIFAEDLEKNIYLQEDLGDMTLFSLIQIESERSRFSDHLKKTYKKVLEDLPKIQIHAGKGLDYSVCYPRSSFDTQSMMWDLNYFKYYFLKLAGIQFDEQALEDDYLKLTSYLMEAESDYFLYRDFQSRNIMLKDEQIYFIDYQGGRKGALQYDLASLLYDAKANIPQEIRDELLDHYINELKQLIPVDEKAFRAHFSAFVMIRIMQAMGAYGFRGFYEKKSHFLASIPFALQNMRYLLDKIDLPIDLPTLIPVLDRLTYSEKLKDIGKQTLQVSINSFSFKRGIPIDESGHGGGFVFDCRALPNPGRYEEYKTLTGRDQQVIDFLNKEEEVDQFFDNCKAIADQSVNKYLERQFNHLSINFGCTGGQHRSVFLAENLARYLKIKYNIKVVLRHREQEMK